MTSTYGRQWFDPNSGQAFDPRLLEADELAIKGDIKNSIAIYKELTIMSAIARRRLLQAKRQIKEAKQNPELGKTVRVSYIDWYPGFTVNDRFIKQIMDGIGVPWQQTSINESDLVIAGSYGNRIMSEQEILRGKIVMFVSGENLNPSYDLHDFSLSTCSSSYCGKNVRYPQWYSELVFEEKEVNLIYAKREFEMVENEIMISAIYNNATPQREEVIYKLRKVFGKKTVKVFGSQRGGEVDKLSILARSRINICFENSIGEGYCTEKLLHALSLGCKALYWGDAGHKKDLAIIYSIYMIQKKKN